MHSKQVSFNIHGDNIVECERTLKLIIDSLQAESPQVYGPSFSAACPRYQINLLKIGKTINFTFFPGFGRWKQNILSLIRNLGGVLREAADAIITLVETNSEFPLIAIEYCGALPAGNQAWQRNGRAYSFGRAGVPYFYIAELGGYELDNERSRKAERMPNPLVPFSYITFSSYFKTPTLPITISSPGARSESYELFKDILGYNDLCAIINSIILEKDFKKIEDSLRLKVIKFVEILASSRKRHDSLKPSQWSEAYTQILSGGNFTDYLLHQKEPLQWTKTAYIEGLTDTASQLMQQTTQYAIGLASTSLPLCLISPENRLNFSNAVENMYKKLPIPFLNWLSQKRTLCICWVMGFKPRGDDARPDRGLVPMARMLTGDNIDILTIVYGPAKEETWPQLENNPVALMNRNGLWEAILSVTDALLIDSSTANSLTQRAFLRSHWSTIITEDKTGESSMLVPPFPDKAGENDVDTVIHTLFDRLGQDFVFEGMCNPPGGDWSGISLQQPDRSIELRWLSLPRVTDINAKRPDHVFEIFGLFYCPIVLSIESKERSSNVEENIGPRLIKYVKDLISSPPSIQRSNSLSRWSHSEVRSPSNEFNFASAVAFIGNANDNISSIKTRASVDLMLIFRFNENCTVCNINVHACSSIGNSIADFMCKISERQKSIVCNKI